MHWDSVRGIVTFVNSHLVVPVKSVTCSCLLSPCGLTCIALAYNSFISSMVKTVSSCAFTDYIFVVVVVVVLCLKPGALSRGAGFSQSTILQDMGVWERQ